jgi:hypothetical protein
MVFQNKNKHGYAEMVKRRLIQEGKAPESFNLKPRKWGTRIPNLPIVEHKGEQYLEVIFLNTGKTSYTLDGNPIAKEQIEGLKSTPFNEDAQGGLNNQVVVRTFKASNITGLTINKKKLTASDIV